MHAFASHWPEYLIEAWALGTFMLLACAVSVALLHVESPLRAWIGDGIASRFVGGLAMGATAIALITSPWGKRSGAHLNPAVTLTFLRLGRIRAADAVGYVVAQCIGGAAGVAVARVLFGEAVAAHPVRYAATLPGVWGVGGAFAGESLIAFVMMAMVLTTTRVPRLAPYTGHLAGVLVCVFITFESPLSGMSMNPARTIASALHADAWRGAWLYLAAPLLGMHLAATWLGRSRSGCAKLVHCPRVRCIFCGHEPCASSTTAAAVSPRTS
ncbi:MAG: aquaporin [Planctomycetes bacterium]|nr:aquaporin [Planctomycetota bacterium]MCC7172408.1 aquaporin [Planctomycetota bacterium]